MPKLLRFALLFLGGIPCYATERPQEHPTARATDRSAIISQDTSAVANAIALVDAFLQKRIPEYNLTPGTWKTVIGAGDSIYALNALDDREEVRLIVVAGAGFLRTAAAANESIEPVIVTLQNTLALLGNILRQVTEANDIDLEQWSIVLDTNDDMSISDIIGNVSEPSHNMLFAGSKFLIEAENEAAIAAVMAHEMGHQQLNHELNADTPFINELLIQVEADSVALVLVSQTGYNPQSLERYFAQREEIAARSLKNANKGAGGILIGWKFRLQKLREFITEGRLKNGKNYIVTNKKDFRLWQQALRNDSTPH